MKKTSCKQYGMMYNAQNTPSEIYKISNNIIIQGFSQAQHLAWPWLLLTPTSGSGTGPSSGLVLAFPWPKIWPLPWILPSPTSSFSLVLALATWLLPVHDPGFSLFLTLASPCSWPCLLLGPTSGRFSQICFSQLVYHRGRFFLGKSLGEKNYTSPYIYINIYKAYLVVRSATRRNIQTIRFPL